MADHIFPNTHLNEKWRAEKEQKLNQKGKAFWMTGLSGAGKSTLAKSVADGLTRRGFFVEVLDGDNIRSGLCSDLGFSIQDRTENIRRIAEVTKLFVANGIIVIVAFISPTAKIRALAKKIIGEADFVEVYINASLESCAKRDTKGLYEKAKNGEIEDFTGIQSPYEAPGNPKIEIKSDGQKANLSSIHLMDAILKNL